MRQKTKEFGFRKRKNLLGKAVLAIVLLAACVVSAFSQDEVEATGKVFDDGNRQIGKAELVSQTNDVKIMFDYRLKMWLDGGKLRIVRPHSGSRAAGINCSFREYKVDSSDPKDPTRWEEIGSGTATLLMPPSSEAQKINVSMTLTKKVVGDDEVAANEKPQKLVIVID